MVMDFGTKEPDVQKCKVTAQDHCEAHKELTQSLKTKKRFILNIKVFFLVHIIMLFKLSVE